MNRNLYHLLDSALSPSTKCSYKNALKHYKKFHDTFYVDSPLLPISTEQLAQFITACHNRSLKASTITSYISAISYIHKLHGFTSPSESFLVKKLLHSIRRHKQSDKRHPFTMTSLGLIVGSLRSMVTDNYTFKLMRAMFLIAFFGLFRVGEIAYSVNNPQNVIKKEDIVFYYKHSKISHASLTIRSYKHSQGQSSIIPINRQTVKKLCPISALKKYLRAAPLGNGYLFRHCNGQPVSTSYFRSVLRSCVVANNMDPSLFTAHSFRIGGATHAHNSNMSSTQIQKLGRWKSTAYLKYIRPTALPIINIQGKNY